MRCSLSEKVWRALQRKCMSGFKNRDKELTTGKADNAWSLHVEKIQNINST